MFDFIFYLILGLLFALFLLEAIASTLLSNIYQKNRSGKLLTGKETFIHQKAKVVGEFHYSINGIYIGKVELQNSTWTAQLHPSQTPPMINSLVKVIAIKGLVLIVETIER